MVRNWTQDYLYNVQTGLLAVFLKLFAFIGDKYLNVRKIRSLDIEERTYHETALRLIVFTERY
jgi:hypothetical protein